jgi:hypothetical protein
LAFTPCCPPPLESAGQSSIAPDVMTSATKVQFSAIKLTMKPFFESHDSKMLMQRQ